MAETKIQWADYTFNPWRGCQKVSPGCTNCYAETMALLNPKVLGEWGPDSKRAIAAESYWRLPLRWNEKAHQAGDRRRVFCASLADVFEARPELAEPRQRLFQLIGQTPNLDWLLLTKRPEVALDNWPLWAGFWASGKSYWEMIKSVGTDYVIPNVWVGVSVEDQQRADERIPQLLQIPAKVHFLSVEPLLGPVDLTRVRHSLGVESFEIASALQGDDGFGLNAPRNRIEWVIIGGESGPHARQCHLEWIRSIVRQCQEVYVPVFVKQLGSHAVRLDPDDDVRGPVTKRLIFANPKGDDPSEWPKDLRVREFPR